MDRHRGPCKSALLLAVGILLQFPLVAGFTTCSAQQEGGGFSSRHAAHVDTSGTTDRNSRSGTTS